MEIFAMTFITLPIWFVALELSKLNKFLKNKSYDENRITKHRN